MTDFHATIKLITGEEIFALVSVDNTEDEPVIIYAKSCGNESIIYWKRFKYDEDKTLVRSIQVMMFIFVLKYDRIITMSEVKDKMIISMYQTYCDEGEPGFGE